jgi:hypothetical protein
VPVGGVELGELGREGGMANNVVLRGQIAASWNLARWMGEFVGVY